MKYPAPVIGITSDTAHADREVNHQPLYFLHQRYVKAVIDAGAIPIILPPVPSSDATRPLLARLEPLTASVFIR